MLNQSVFSGDASVIDTRPADLQTIFSSEILSKLEAVREKRADNLIIRGFPVPENIGPTPKEIHSSVADSFARRVVEMLSAYLGKISEKGIENSIRFPIAEDGSTNVETWHGHPQFSYSVFFCMRGDDNAKTYFLSANDTIAEASEKEREMLIRSKLLNPTEGGYEFSADIYHPSDFEQYVENLDLPDTTKALHIGREDEAFRYLLRKMTDAEDKIIYQPGDVALYNERQTMRFSPSYLPTTEAGSERWLLGAGIE